MCVDYGQKIDLHVYSNQICDIIYPVLVKDITS